ncbi:hypothetical protein AVEN_27006-1 [Araneus ventricosus]|uniref:Uncharacterized protein n=1 Tax=Araneus ventricosus TaxID=182803 RepID=A0A4Y2PY10_ARAVE|nr:hypothetical protein AVEN_204214-1 [Araneus ventricosus]GBN55785.1 hypothetical protein AVEN_125719-1 [Araneus ventricosus]GBN59233.1 hypothetical protein AVEN_27006-1 [Araneus ventricosus]
MFILPALLYLKVLPLFGQRLHHFIVPYKSRPPHAGGAALSPLVLSLPHPSWVGRASVGIFALGMSDSFLWWSRIHESESGCGSGSADSFRFRNVNGFIADNYCNNLYY